MAGGVDIRDEDHGYAEVMHRFRHQLRGAVMVGVDDRPHDPTGQPTDEIGAYHEFGFGVPERSFLRAWVAENTLAIQEKIADLALAQLLDNAEDWREPFGRWAQGQIRHHIFNDHIPPPLDPRTVARKGNDTPLFDSGQLAQAILFELEAV